MSTLRNLVKECIQTVLETQSMDLYESVAYLRKHLTNEELNKVMIVFNKLKQNPNIIQNYTWTPTGSYNKELNSKQLNLLVELIYESKDKNFARNMFMVIYNEHNTSLINTFSLKLSNMRNVLIEKNTLANAMELAWNQMFIGVSSKKTGELNRNFSNVYEEYNPNQNSNFGAYLMTNLFAMLLNSFRYISGKENPLSLSAPRQNRNADSEEDILRGDTSGKSLEKSLADKTGEPEQTKSLDKKEAHKMILILIKSIKEGIKDFIKTSNITPGQEKGLKGLELLISTGKSPEEISQNLGYNITTYIQDLKKNKSFLDIINNRLFTNGFLDARGKVQNFANIKPLYISRAVDYMKTGNTKQLQDLSESVSWFFNLICN